MTCVVEGTGLDLLAVAVRPHFVADDAPAGTIDGLALRHDQDRRFEFLPQAMRAKPFKVDKDVFLTQSRWRVAFQSMPEPSADLLRAYGLPVTAQRLAVLRAVAGRPHATADELADDVRVALGTISRQAVYDALAVLVEKGILRRIAPAGSPARYEDRVGDNHHHLICRACGETVDVDCAVGPAPCLKPAASHGFEIDEAEVIYWGMCAQCRKTPPPAGAGATRHRRRATRR